MDDPTVHSEAVADSSCASLGARRLALRVVLAVVATASVASLLAAAVAAEEIKPGDDNEAEPSYATGQSACVGDAANDQGFVDVPADHPLKVAINCLAYYGISAGTGDGTTFSPDAAVTGTQTAAFMERTARLVGVDPDDVIGPLDAAAPAVTRAEAAVLVARLLVALTDEDSDPNLKIGDFGAITIDGMLPEDFFADSRDTQPLPIDSAVSALYELGVTEGRPDGGFAPDEPATRGEVAELITGALTHTRVRPEGVSIQQDMLGEVVVSVRDSDFAPVEDAPVDAFSVATRLLDTSAFKSDGTCGTVRVPQGGDTGSKCSIGPSDPVTNLNGDVVLQVKIDERGGTTVWAWTGEEGDRVTGGGAGLARVDLTEVGPVVAEGAKVTNDLAEGARRVRFGDTVTVTVQLTGAGGKNALRPREGASYRVTLSTSGPSDSAFGFILRDDSTGSAQFTITGRSDSSASWNGHVDNTGKLTFTITALDPRPDDTDNVQITYRVGNAPGNTLDPPTGGTCTTDEQAPSTISRCPVFSDAEPEPTKVEVTTPATFLTVPAGRASASNTAIIAVTSQYGKPLGGVEVMLTSSHPERVEIGRDTASTRRDGRARISYRYQSSEPAEETLTARLPAYEGVEDTTTVYWMAEPGSNGEGPVRLSRVDENTIIVDTGSGQPALISYDVQDHLYYEGQPVTLATFKDQLAGWEEDIADGDAAEEVSRFRLAWRYLNSASGIARLQLTRAR